MSAWPARPSKRGPSLATPNEKSDDGARCKRSGTNRVEVSVVSVREEADHQQQQSNSDARHNGISNRMAIIVSLRLLEAGFRPGRRFGPGGHTISLPLA